MIGKKVSFQVNLILRWVCRHLEIHIMKMVSVFHCFRAMLILNFGFLKIEFIQLTQEAFAEKYDILISVRAPVGAQNMAKEKCCIGRGVAAFRYKQNNSFYTYTHDCPVKIMPIEAQVL